MLSKNIQIEAPILLHSLTEDNFAASVAAMKELIESAKLSTLSYQQITLTDIQCRFIADVIAQSTKLNGFILSQCNMPTMAFRIILDAITVHPCITELTFEDITLINYHLADANDDQNPFSYRDVGSTKIANQQAILIASMLTQNPRIKRLNLDDNEIENEGGLALAKALETQPNLWELKLSGRHFSDEIKSKIKELTQRNKAFIIKGPTHQAQGNFWKARSADHTAMPEIPSLKSLCQYAVDALIVMKNDNATDEKLATLPAEIKPNN